MRLPGFTAEATVGRPSQTYRGPHWYGGPSSVQPATAGVLPSQWGGAAYSGYGTEVLGGEDDLTGLMGWEDEVGFADETEWYGDEFGGVTEADLKGTDFGGMAGYEGMEEMLAGGDDLAAMEEGGF